MFVMSERLWMRIYLGLLGVSSELMRSMTYNEMADVNPEKATDNVEHMILPNMSIMALYDALHAWLTAHGWKPHNPQYTTMWHDA